MALPTRGIWLVALALLWLTLPAITAAQDTNQAGLVVIYGDGTAITRCVHFEEQEISGFELLKRSDLDLKYDSSTGFGTSICKIDQEGCDFPAESCFCHCEGVPCSHWSYWYRDSEEWVYSQLGSDRRTVEHGDVDGWSWGESALTEGSELTLPDTSFADVCAAPVPTATAKPPTSSKPITIPEPLTLLLYGTGVAGIGLRAWRKRQRGE